MQATACMTGLHWTPWPRFVRGHVVSGARSGYLLGAGRAVTGRVTRAATGLGIGPSKAVR